MNSDSVEEIRSLFIIWWKMAGSPRDSNWQLQHTAESSHRGVRPLSLPGNYQAPAVVEADLRASVVGMNPNSPGEERQARDRAQLLPVGGEELGVGDMVR